MPARPAPDHRREEETKKKTKKDEFGCVVRVGIVDDMILMSCHGVS
jgi:hypothetical protein